MADFVRTVIFKEIIPTLNLPKNELDSFAEDTLERFRNPFIDHELISISLNSISKFKVRVLPSILQFHEQNGCLPKNLTKALASLIVFYKGSYKGQEIQLRDKPYIIQFMSIVWEYGDLKRLVNQVLANELLWNQDLTKIDGLENGLIRNIIPLLEKDYI